MDYIKRGKMRHLPQMLLIFLSLCHGGYARYVEEDGIAQTYIQHKTNHGYYDKKYTTNFRNELDIIRYLKLYGTDMMLWTCRNAVQPYYDGKPIPIVELYCEVIGLMRTVTWYHNSIKIPDDEPRFTPRIIPHSVGGTFFARWIDFKLHIFNATEADSGVYTFEVVSPNGRVDAQQLYVDISVKHKKLKLNKDTYVVKRKKRRRSKRRKGRRRNRKNRKRDRDRKSRAWYYSS